MGKGKKRARPNGWMIPVVAFRTPEQHRALIQPKREVVATGIPKPPKSRAKRVRLSRAGNGTASLSARMLAMGLRRYSDYLLTAHWFDVKRRWKESDQFRGWFCHSFGCDSRKRLSLHHWTYERVGREELTDLVLVCEDCHNSIHRLERGGMPLDEATRRVTKHRPAKTREERPMILSSGDPDGEEYAA